MTWKVYGLIDPRDNRLFYIGITQNMRSRFGCHQTDRSSSAYEMCQDILENGLVVRYCLFGEFEHKEMARFLEDRLILCIPQTYNATLFDEGFKLWEPMREKYFAGGVF